MSFQSHVSVIIPTLNGEKNIGRCLEAMRKQTYPKEKIEVIVVDNNSTDKTKEIAEKSINLKSYKVGKEKKLSTLRTLKTFNSSNFQTLKLYSHGPERSAQRNYGIAKAKGEYILFLDADMSLSEKVIEECVKNFQIFNRD